MYLPLTEWEIWRLLNCRMASSATARMGAMCEQCILYGDHNGKKSWGAVFLPVSGGASAGNDADAGNRYGEQRDAGLFRYGKP